MKKSKEEIIKSADRFDKAIISERKHRGDELWEAPMPTRRSMTEFDSKGSATDGAALSDALYLQRVLPPRPQEEFDDMKTMLTGLGEADGNPWDADVQERKDLLRYRSAYEAETRRRVVENMQRHAEQKEMSDALMERYRKNDPDISKNRYGGLSQQTLPSDFKFRR